MVLGITRAVTKAAKLIGETKNLRVLSEHCKDGVKTLSSFDKKTGALVKQVTIHPKYVLPKGHEGRALRLTNVEEFREGQTHRLTTIWHMDLVENSKGHLSCHSKHKDNVFENNYNDFFDDPYYDYAIIDTPDMELNSLVEIHVLDQNKNQKKLRAIKREETLESISYFWFGGHMDGTRLKHRPFAFRAEVEQCLRDDLIGRFKNGDIIPLRTE